MIFPNKYIALSQNVYKNREFKIVPIRYEDRFKIMKWRNEQMYHLRQSKVLTKFDQENYFKNVVSKLFYTEQPSQILFTFLKNDNCIGYGGLVHIDWGNKSAEISFIMDTRLEKKYFENLWTIFLYLIEKVAFSCLNFKYLFTYAFDLRKNLYVILEKNNYLFKKRIKNKLQIQKKWIDVVIHEKENKKIIIRHATKKDEMLLFSWRNEQDVRIQSFDSNKIKLKDHSIWFTKKLKDPNFIFYILEIQNNPFGLIKIEKGKDNATIGISIDKNYRGKGLASKALYIACKEYFKNEEKPIFAFIKKTNSLSIKSFKRIGFQLLNETIVNNIPSLILQLKKL